MSSVLRALCLAALIGAIAPAWAATQVDVCFNYGCQSQATVAFDEALLQAAAAELAQAQDAAQERARLATVIGWLYRAAGTQSAIGADRKGNRADEGVFGKMDCIDHSTTTTRLLDMLQARGLLHFHRVVPKARRTSFVLFQHFSAVVEEIDAPSPVAAPQTTPDHVPVLMALCDCVPPAPPAGAQPIASAARSDGARYVVDSWFVEQGEPAVVLPLADWLDGDGPNVP